VPHNKSCKKRLKTSKKANLSNSQNRASMRSAMRKFRATIGEASDEEKVVALRKTIRALVSIRLYIFRKATTFSSSLASPMVVTTYINATQVAIVYKCIFQMPKRPNGFP